MLKLTNIKKDYKVASNYVHALKGVDLEFRKSEFVCVLGQSGCGKTTLLNIIGGLDHYTSGDLVIQGKSTKDFSDRDWDVYRNHRIGFIFQSYNLIPHQTVLGNVELALTIAGIGREERHERAKRALERVGLGNELDKRPNQLSGGQMQRVAIARALVNNPDILLADEPTGALDSETSVQIMELIKEIAHERLVIMVTHNPELADLYASRIVRLKDGTVESDSMPYDSAAEEPANLVEETASATDGKKQKKRKKLRARMSFLSSLVLSAKNLLTKKGRTIVTSIAGSIGIISVCLVLALSSGFNSYIKRTEEDMLSYYPVQITENTFDVTSIMMSFTSPKDLPDLSELGDKVYVDSFLSGLANKMAVKNNISENYLNYIKSFDPEWYAAIQYGYGAMLTDNLYTEVETGDIDLENNGVYNDAVTRQISLSYLKNFYIQELQAYVPEYKELVGYADFFGNIVHKMPGSLSYGEFGKYVQSQYDVIAGEFPTSENAEREAVLVVGNNNEATDLTLAQLGLLDEKTFLALFPRGEEGKPGFTIPFDDIVGKEYVLFYNDAVFTENEDYEKPSFSSTKMSYPFEYKGQLAEPYETGTEHPPLSAKEGEGLNIKITGILRLKDGLTYGCLDKGLNLTEQTIEKYIETNARSKIVQWLNSEESEFKIPGYSDDYKLTLAPASPASSIVAEQFKSLTAYAPEATALSWLMVSFSQDTVVRSLGGDHTVSSISIYAKDFDGKNAILDYLEVWNDACEKEGTINGVQLVKADKITYTDTVGLLMGMMQTMLDVITIVLVAFTAISLVVSSVMIGIITYVSVVERIKEIGVLRSLGARKQDIRNLFNAETFIIGLAAGLFGIIVTYLLSFGINAIIYSFTEIAGICALSPLTAFIMVCVSVALTLISGLIPAQSAAKKDPVIALRTE